MRMAFATCLALLVGCVVRFAAAPVVEVEPPAPRVVVAPTPRAGHIWVQGRWEFVGGQWVWRDGHWQAERSGYVWRDGSWQQEGGRYHWVEGRWEPALAPPPVDGGAQVVDRTALSPAPVTPVVVTPAPAGDAPHHEHAHAHPHAADDHHHHPHVHPHRPGTNHHHPF